MAAPAAACDKPPMPDAPPPPALSLAAYQARVGLELGTGDWALVDQPAIDAFAELTGDRQFIHVDPARAAKTPFGGTIAHAFFVLSLLGGQALERLPTLEGAQIGLNYGFDRVRFMNPVRSGKRVRPRFRLKAVEPRREGQVLVTVEATVEIEGEAKPALVADWLVMMLGAAG